MRNLSLSFLVLISLAATQALAQAPYELTCRNKAKEIAVTTYQTCVTENKAARLKEIREGYKSELEAVKAKYDGMLSELNGGKSTTEGAKKAAAKPTQKGAAMKRAEKPTPGIARQLPTKANDNGPALPLQQDQDEETTSVVLKTETETEPEIIEIPAEN